MEVDCHDDKLDASGGFWNIKIIVMIPWGLGFVLKPKQFSWYIKEEDHKADLESDWSMPHSIQQSTRCTGTICQPTKSVNGNRRASGAPYMTNLTLGGKRTI